MFWEHRESKSIKVMQCRADYRRSRNDGDLELDQLLHECMFFKDGAITPTCGAIELGDQRLVVFDADLIHAVLVTIEGKQTTIATQADTLQCVEHAVGGEVGVVRCGHGSRIPSFPRKRESSNKTKPAKQDKTESILNKNTGFPPTRE